MRPPRRAGGILLSSRQQKRAKQRAKQPAPARCLCAPRSPACATLRTLPPHHYEERALPALSRLPLRQGPAGAEINICTRAARAPRRISCAIAPPTPPRIYPSASHLRQNSSTLSFSQLAAPVPRSPPHVNFSPSTTLCRAACETQHRRILQRRRKNRQIRRFWRHHSRAMGATTCHQAAVRARRAGVAHSRKSINGDELFTAQHAGRR